MDFTIDIARPVEHVFALKPLIVRPIRNENRRTLAMMKQCLEQEVRA
ncbi:MAG TPA: hypothetical protein VIG77_18205 [Ktedonobacterales bacterium]|jgi:hypothetical protein